MPSQKSSPKKGSKLASLKSAIMNATKKKVASVAARSAAKGSAHAPKKTEKVEMKDLKDLKDKKTSHSSHGAKNAHGAHPSHSAHSAPSGKGGKKGAAAHADSASGGKGATAAAPAKPAGPALTKKSRAPKKQEVPYERMAGPSIRISYDSNGEAVCREVACEGLSTSAGYCRMHYIKNWKKIKRKEVILKEGKLNQYIEELVTKYPDKYIEAIRQDLANDKDFAKVIYDLDLDESVDDFDPEGENLDSVIGDIKRDFDDEGDSGF
jgi:hypothetical protein